MQAPQEWHDLSVLGFPGWEHAGSYRTTTDTSRGGFSPLHTEVRMKGASFVATLFDDGRGLFNIIASHIEAVEARIALQDARAA